MPEAQRHDASFRIACAGPSVEERVHARLAERLARGEISPEEIDRVANARLFVFDGGAAMSEAFRRCCVAWEADRPGPITSHRPVVGVLLVAVKKLVARALRFQNEAFLARQREFNRNLLIVLRDLLERRPER